MNERNLIERVKNSDESAFEILLNNYHNLIYKIINSFTLKRGEFIISKEDLYQEASMAFHEACLLYSDDKNACFSTFAYMLIKRRIVNKYRDLSVPYRFEITSYDATRIYEYVEFENSIAEPHEAFYTNDLYERLNNKIEELSDIDKEIIRLRYNNVTYKEIGERLNLDRKKVDNRIYYLKKTLSKCLLEREDFSKKK